MKTRYIFLVPCIFLFFCGFGLAGVPSKPDFITYNADKSVKTRGVYQTDSSGRVLKFTVSDASGKVIYVETPFYSPEGAIVRADRTSASGDLQKVVVYFKDKALVFDSDGRLLDSQGFSQADFLSAATK